ncbi:MAG TPA: VIT1/CCC1 transporter family protein [Candidatus Acidoferrum sp.]
MPQTPHVERHFTGSETVRDVVIGMSDGLTVPFALAAGLSGAVSSAHVVVVAGLAEIAAGSIAMGLGGFLAAKSDAEHYEQELARERKEVETIPEAEASEVSEIFESYGLSKEESSPIVAALRQKPRAWVNFMMRFELGLEEPLRGRALRSALTIAGAYAIGGFVPLFPYMLLTQMRSAFSLSVTLTLLALFIFGYIKGRFTGSAPLRGAVQTLIIGALAAAAAFFIAKLIS